MGECNCQSLRHQGKVFSLATIYNIIAFCNYDDSCGLLQYFMVRVFDLGHEFNALENCEVWMQFPAGNKSIWKQVQWIDINSTGSNRETEIIQNSISSSISISESKGHRKSNGKVSLCNLSFSLYTIK